MSGMSNDDLAILQSIDSEGLLRGGEFAAAVLRLSC